MLKQSIGHGKHALQGYNPILQSVKASNGLTSGQYRYFGSSSIYLNQHTASTISNPSESHHTYRSKPQYAVYTPRSTYSNESSSSSSLRPRKVRKNQQRKHQPLITKLQEQINVRDLEGVKEIWKEIIDKRIATEVKSDLRFMLIKLISSDKTETSTSDLLSLFTDLRSISDWRDATLVLRSLIDRNENEKAWQCISSSLSSNQAGNTSSAVLPPSAYEGLIICACFAAAASLSDSPFQQIVNLVGPLKPFWSKLKLTARTKADRMHGSPLHSETNNDRFSTFKVDEQIRQLAKTLYQHAIMAWGTQYTGEQDEFQSSLLSRRITAACNSGYFSTMNQWLDILPQAHNEWLTMSFDGRSETQWTDKTWAALLQGLITHRKAEMAGRAWNLYFEMKPKSDQIGAGIWNGLLQGYSAAGQWDQARAVRKQMLEQNANQDQYTFTTLISMNFKARTPSEAVFTFEELKEWCREQKQVVNPVAMNAMVFGYCLINDVAEAERVVNRMLQGDESDLIPAPNVATMNIMLRTYARRDNLEGIVKILNMIGQLNLEPDAYTYTTVLDALTRMGYGKHTGDVYDLMMKEGIKGSEVTLSAVIKDALTSIEGETPIRFEFALSTLRRMELKGPFPTQITYTNIISGLFNNAGLFTDFVQKGGLSHGYKWKDIEAAKVIETTMLEPLYKNRPEIVLSLLLLKRMQDMKLQPNRKTYNTLLDGLLSQSIRVEEDQNQIAGLVASIDVWTLRKVGELLREMVEVQSIEVKESTVVICEEGLQQFLLSKHKSVQEEAFKSFGILRRLMKAEKSSEKNYTTIEDSISLAFND